MFCSLFPVPCSLTLLMGDPTLRLLELDERHNKLLDRLSELDQQVVIVLDEWTRAKELVHNDKGKSGENDCLSAA